MKIDEKKAGVWKRYYPNGALYDEVNSSTTSGSASGRTFNADGKLAKTTRHKRTR